MDGRFVIKVSEVNVADNSEVDAYEYEHDFYSECLVVVQSITAGFWIDEHRVALAKGEEVTYEMPFLLRKIKIVER